MIRVDGSVGEGGGSIVRHAIALSLLTQKPFKLYNIRKNRSKPGLSEQHYKSIQLALDVTNSKVVGHRKGSLSIEFYPKPIKNKKARIEMSTAASISLCCQSIVLPYVFSDKKINMTLTGGTDVANSPSIDYFKNVFLAELRDYATSSVTTLRRGYFPKGQGEVQIKIAGKNRFKPFTKIEYKKPFYVKGISHSSKDQQQRNVAEKQKEACNIILSDLNIRVSIQSIYDETVSSGNNVTLWAISDFGETQHVIGRYINTFESVKPFDLGESVARRLKKDIQTSVLIDEHQLDQLLLPISIVGGALRYEEITPHVKSNMYLANLFLGTMFENDEKSKVLTVREPYLP